VFLDFWIAISHFICSFKPQPVVVRKLSRSNATGKTSAGRPRSETQETVEKFTDFTMILLA
jgi:hypothetical protein